MSTTLALFWYLSSSNKKERLDASVKLVGALEQFQAHFIPQQHSQSHSDEEDEEAEAQALKGKEDGLDALNSQDVSYSMRRLVRGLASPRESSRLGFAVALTELLSRLDSVTCAQIVALINDSTKAQGSMTGQEERDVLFARLFGLTSVIQSGLAVRTGTLHTSPSSSVEISTLSAYADVVSQLIALGEKKSWLRESAWHVILLCVDVLHEAKVKWKLDGFEATIQQVFVDYKFWTPEKIAVALKLQSLQPERDWTKMFAPTFKNGDIVASINLPTLARILKESAIEESEESIKPSMGPWKPQLHFAWIYLLEKYLPGLNSTNAPQGSFQDFFRVVVDESFFSTSSSPQRKYSGFQVFQKALSRIDEEHMPMLFTRNFMRSWINHLSNRDGYLHKIAQQTATEVQSFVKHNPHLGFSLILQLTGVHGSQNFDKLTKTKTIESVISSLDTKGIQEYIQWLFTQVDEFEDTDKLAIPTINHKRRWAIEQLFALIRNGSIPKSDDWVQSVLEWLVVHGIFLVKKKSHRNSVVAARRVANPPFSDELRKHCRTRLLSCLSELNTQTTLLRAGDKTIKTSAVASDGEFWVSKTLKTVAFLQADTKHISILVEVDEEEQILRQKALESVIKLNDVSEDQREDARGAEFLLLATTLQHYCADDPDDINNESLRTCIEGTTRMFPEARKKKKKTVLGEDENEGEGTYEPVDILVDTIIGFLEESTAYLKTTAIQVFALLSGSVKESTVDLILTQLERRDPTMNDDDEDDIEMGSSGEAGESEDEGEAAEDEESSEEDSDDDDDAEEILGDEESLALRRKIEQALRVNGIEPATGDSDSEEELMDDEAMFAIDEQLAEVFRSRASEKKTTKNGAQREATHFKIRVLDLIDTYFKKQPSNPLVLQFITPLVELIIGTGSDEQQLSEKTKGIFSNRLVPKLNQLPSTISKQPVVKVYLDIHNYARRVHIPGVQAALKQCSIHLSKCLLNLGAEEEVLEAYRASLINFFTRKNSALHPGFFEDFFRQNPSTGWKLRQDILECSDTAINGHRQSQSFQLLSILLQMISKMPVHQPEWIGFLPSFVSKVLEVACGSCGEKATLNSNQLKAVIRSAIEALRLMQRYCPEDLPKLWKADPWISLRSQLVGCKRFKDATGLHQSCDQIINAITKTESISKTKDKKRKTGDVPLAPEHREQKRKKVKGDA